MKDYPLVSIVLLTYNHEPYINDCLLGILEQDYPNMEFIIFDDASNDNTVKVIESYREKFLKKFVNFVFLKNKKNSGNISQNVNYMLDIAKGIYIKTLSGDDIMIYNCISKLVKCLLNNPQCSLVYSNGYVVGNDYHYDHFVNKKDKLYGFRKSGVEFKELFKRLMFGNFVAAPTIMIKKEVFDTLGFFDESMPYEDYEYWLRIACNGGIFYYLNELLVYYRRADNSITNFSGKEKKRKIEHAILADGKAIKKYIRYLLKGERLMCKKAYYQRYLKISWESKCWNIFFSVGYQFMKNEIKLHALTSECTTINESLLGALGIPELRLPNRR